MASAPGIDSAIVFSGIAPHPPIMIPEVGGAASGEVRGSIDAMAELTRRIIESGPENRVLSSPHAPLDASASFAYHSAKLSGNFANFARPRTVEFPETRLLRGIPGNAAEENTR